MPENTERFAILETEMKAVHSDIKELGRDIRLHAKDDEGSFKELNKTVNSLALKVMGLATAGSLIGAVIMRVVFHEGAP